MNMFSSLTNFSIWLFILGFSISMNAISKINFDDLSFDSNQKSYILLGFSVIIMLFIKFSNQNKSANN